jgi:hypothetical protein
MSKRIRTKPTPTLDEQFPPSPPCGCLTCLSYCARPGWWTVAEAGRAIDAGLGPRMMLEMAPDHSFGVLAPAFRGNELAFAQQRFASGGCGFLKDDRCELHGSGLQPLECRHCHHERPGAGPRCHDAIEREWDSAEGRALVVRWAKLTGFWERQGVGRLAARLRKE